MRQRRSLYEGSPVLSTCTLVPVSPDSENVTQKVKNNPDGSIILGFEASGCFDIKQWILGLGAEAKVLAPDKLRQNLADEVKRMAENLR